MGQIPEESNPWDFEDNQETVPSDDYQDQGPPAPPIPSTSPSRTTVTDASRGREPAPGISLPQPTPVDSTGQAVSIPPTAADEAIAESDAIDAMTGEAGDMIESEPADNPPDRGAPIENRAELRQQWRRAGGERIRVLTDSFGEDATMVGHLLFQIPPLAVRVNKGVGVFRWKPLRTKESIAVKSGNGECFIEMDLAFVGIQQIRDSLSSLIALWKKAPITFFENAHVRKMMIPDMPEDSMAVCLETLVLDAVAGKPNTVWATLMLRWFNYKPFTSNFWYRESWQTSALGTSTYNSTSSGADAETVAVPASDAETSIIDLSALESVDTMSISQPPEARLSYHERTSNPGDPFIEVTNPVVYPFNSRPFVDYINNGIDSAVRVPTWSDNLVMKWNSFVRYQVPRSWQYSVDSPREVSIAAQPVRDRGSEAQPAPVEGNRDVILFMGDSIMVGFLGLGGVAENGLPGAPPWETANWVQGTTESYFPAESGFTYYCSCRTGMRSSTMADWWDQIKGRSELKNDGEDDLSRLAGLVIHMGTNDGLNGPELSHIQRVMEEASTGGAIPVLLPLPPSGDDLTASPVMRSWYRRGNPTGSLPAVDAFYSNIDRYHSEMVAMAGRISNAVGPDQIDYHAVATDSERRDAGRASPLARTWQQRNSPVTGVYNIHWNAAGKRAGGAWIQSHLPWSSLSGEAAPDGLWHVCEVEDGDTVTVWRVNPESEERESKVIRMLYIDTLESYGRHGTMEESPSYSTADLNRWLPDGQDSWRPANKQWANLAKEHLVELIGGGDPGLEITENGTGEYGRTLGIISKAGQDLNLKMVEDGFAYHNPSDTGGEGQRYLDAQATARAGGTGIWGPQYTPLSGEPEDLPDSIRERLEIGMKPSDWRSTYPPDSDGGHGGGTPVPCPPAS